MMGGEGLLLQVLFLLDIFCTTGSIRLDKLSVPDSAELGSTVQLSCTFTIQMSEEVELDVKWYHNSSSTPILVWVPYSRVPYLLPSSISEYLSISSFEDAGDRIPRSGTEPNRVEYLQSGTELSFPRSGTRTKTLISEITLQADSFRLSGEYSCKVSTFSQEIIVGRNIIVYEAPERFWINQSLSYGELTVSCSVWAGYPTPVLTLCKQGIQGDCDYRVSTNDAVYEDSQDYGEEDYLVDPRLVLISSVFSLQSLQDVAKFTCTLHIPGTSFKKEEEKIFNKYPSVQPLPMVSRATSSAPTNLLTSSAPNCLFLQLIMMFSHR
ncbi:uncharacterized protein LOC111715408 [Eurytemora carolleeae]|uniref:uncharacterized protein LOC111715408 n=1 Tax=Eurytemora carolleeae TaxID=1294199 RepID=UPI000C75BE7F|nr:uncharacterized protein LOC111715408 [Eurytemora carolleeae]|eukprot:XP_023346488.1 uncharacterized protein LOC111715408 [Eurytemora affinis]